MMGYDGSVIRFVRLATAALLTASLTAFPLVADWCAISCDAVHVTTAEAAPACHHANSSTPLIGGLPTACGHDHQPIVVAAATAPAGASRLIAAPTSPVTNIVFTGLLVPLSPTMVGRDANSSPPFPLALASILRV